MADNAWLVLRVRSPSAEQNAWLAEGLIACGGQAVQEDGEWLHTWLPAQDPEETVAAARERLASLVSGPLEIEWELQPGQDWTARWREGLGPRRVGKHLIVSPSWSAPSVAPDDILIVIDPQMAFGTGEHASTRGVLRLLEAVPVSGCDVLDVGTGSAVLAIAATRLGATSVLAVESDADALINARENVAGNACETSITLQHAVVDAAFLRTRARQWDIVLANVLSGVLRPLLAAFRSSLRPGGNLILGGILQSEAPAMIEAAGVAGLELMAEDREDEWWSARFAC